MFDRLGQIWDWIFHPFLHIVTLPLPVSSRNLTPSLLTLLHLLFPSLLCTPPSPVLPHLHPLRSPHLTAYPGRTLGDSATGGCGRGLPVHGTAWSAQPLLSTPILSLHICESLRSIYTLHCSLDVKKIKACFTLGDTRCNITDWGVVKVIHRWKVQPIESRAAAVLYSMWIKMDLLFLDVLIQNLNQNSNSILKN